MTVKYSDTRKVVSFNPESDKKMLKFLEDKKFSTYIKSLIKRDMEGTVELSLSDVTRLLGGIGITVPPKIETSTERTDVLEEVSVSSAQAKGLNSLRRKKR